MNITLNEKNIEKIQSSYEIIILNKIKYLSPQEQELFRNINFFKKSFNTHFDMKNKRLYISCLKFEKNQDSLNGRERERERERRRWRRRR